jgi:hypothetical protein
VSPNFEYLDPSSHQKQLVVIDRIEQGRVILPWSSDLILGFFRQFILKQKYVENEHTNRDRR